MAHALAHRSGKALIPAAAFAFAMDRGQIPAEEAALARKFGGPYRRYQREVPRWVGRRHRAAR